MMPTQLVLRTVAVGAYSCAQPFDFCHERFSIEIGKVFVHWIALRISRSQHSCLATSVKLNRRRSPRSFSQCATQHVTRDFLSQYYSCVGRVSKMEPEAH